MRFLNTVAVRLGGDNCYDAKEFVRELRDHRVAIARVNHELVIDAFVARIIDRHLQARSVCGKVPGGSPSDE